MSGDRHLRALQRAPQDPEGEARLLSERLRRGEADPERLALAAYLGHGPAREALGAQAPAFASSFNAFLTGLRRWGAGAWVRAALAGAREVVALWDTRHASDPRPREALTATEEWLRHRTSERAKQAHAAADACYLILGELEEPTAGAPGPPWPERWATAFRETRAAGLAALSAAHVGDMSFRYAKLSLTASRERLALAEVPGGPGGAALFSRAAQVDRLGHLPELDTESSARLLRARIAAELLPRALAE